MRIVRIVVFVMWSAGLALAASEKSSVESLMGKKVAVTVFALNRPSEPFAKTAQTRLEEILVDNDVVVLDEKKTEELKNVCKGLEDPGVFVTAETFVENARKFDISGLLAAYLTIEVVTGLTDYYSATAHADIRYVDNQTARVRSLSTPAMGIPGRPPSDGLTSKSAAINAIQRAIDSACDQTGFKVADWTRPKLVDLQMEGPTRCDGSGVFPAPENDTKLWGLAPLENQTWRKEEVTCTARALAGHLAAVAGYIKDTDFHRKPERLYGSRVHVIDLEGNRVMTSFVCSPVEMKTREEPETKQVLACLFVQGWRYLFAVTGNHILMWDVEKGALVSKLPVPSLPTGLALDNGSALVGTRNGNWRYRVTRASH